MHVFGPSQLPIGGDVSGFAPDAPAAPAFRSPAKDVCWLRFTFHPVFVRLLSGPRSSCVQFTLMPSSHIPPRAFSRRARNATCRAAFSISCSSELLSRCAFGTPLRMLRCLRRCVSLLIRTLRGCAPSMFLGSHSSCFLARIPDALICCSLSRNALASALLLCRRMPALCSRRELTHLRTFTCAGARRCSGECAAAVSVHDAVLHLGHSSSSTILRYGYTVGMTVVTWHGTPARGTPVPCNRRSARSPSAAHRAAHEPGSPADVRSYSAGIMPFTFARRLQAPALPSPRAQPSSITVGWRKPCPSASRAQLTKRVWSPFSPMDSCPQPPWTWPKM